VVQVMAAGVSDYRVSSLPDIFSESGDEMRQVLRFEFGAARMVGLAS
jgi:hypothetical protein